MNDNITINKPAAKNMRKTDGIKRVVKLILCIVSVLFFMFFIGPMMDKLPLVKPLVQFIDEREIDASALYYTEIEEFSEANSNMENTMKYLASELDKQK